MIISTMIFYIGVRLGNEFYRYKYNEYMLKTKREFFVLLVIFSYLASELIENLITNIVGSIPNTGLIVQIIRYITRDFDQFLTNLLAIAGIIILTHFSFNIIKAVLLKLKEKKK